MKNTLTFSDLCLDFQDERGQTYNLLDDVSFSIKDGRAVGIVGESGCGKSITSLAVMGLLPPAAHITSGSILFEGENLVTKTEKEMYAIRGKGISMIFQEPMTSLNPVLTIGFQIEEVIRRHEPSLSKAQLKTRTLDLLDKVGIPNPQKRINNYPHQFSGGMRQRTMIAIAIACHPQLLIADEPTTALDVTIQAQVLDLMMRLKTDGAMMLITHNLGIVAEVCEDVVVMYAGQIVESGSVRKVFKNPSHPYTQGLIRAIPTLDTKVEVLDSIPGVVPAVQHFPGGCRFAPRCPNATSLCSQERPGRVLLSESHMVACHLIRGETVNHE
jgi:oligopeptide/dipeptide ABC transporter ATP-binding protein